MNEPDPKLLEALICPITKTTLIYDRTRGELISRAAGLAFPIRNGVPILIESEARTLAGDPTIDHFALAASPADTFSDI